MSPRPSSIHLILVFRCHLQAKCGGGEESKEEGWEAFDPDADLQPEGEEEDMHVFQSDAGAGGKGRGRSRCVQGQGGREGLRAPGHR